MLLADTTEKKGQNRAFCFVTILITHRATKAFRFSAVNFKNIFREEKLTERLGNFLFAVCFELFLACKTALLKEQHKQSLNFYENAFWEVVKSSHVS